jgi:hypothetical protein
MTTQQPQVSQPQQNGMGTAALVLGIIALAAWCAGLIPAILAIIFGKIGMTKADQGLANNRGMAKAGFILGIVALGIWGFWIIVWIIAAASSTTTTY